MFHPPLMTALTLCLASACSWAASNPVICVWDPVGKGGPLFERAQGYGLAMQKFGVDLTVKAYSDEHVAAEDFRVGQCAGLMATSIRTKTYNAVTAALDYPGATTIITNGKIDNDASYDVLYKALQVLAAPGAASLNVQGNYEVGGILPMGAIYTMVRDRTIFQRGFAGARIAAFDNDKVQAYLFSSLGAQPVAVDIRNFVNMFNNGNVDVIFSPAMAYKPLEIYRGIGTKGGVSRLPLAFSSQQLVFDRSKFPEGFGDKSRQYFLGQYERVVATVRKADQDIPPEAWVDYPAEAGVAFVNGQRTTRISLANKGYYSKQGLKFMKRVRCSVNNTATDCATKEEIDW